MRKPAYAVFSTLMLGLIQSGPAVAETISLACSSQPGQAPHIFLSVDLDNATVATSTGVYAANISSARISWDEPFQDYGGGSYRPALRYALERATGTLTGSGDNAFISAVCQRGERPKPVL